MPASARPVDKALVSKRKYVPVGPTMMFNVRLPHALVDRIDAMAEKYKQTRSQIVRSVLETILTDRTDV
jgi:hypothetical protein